MTNSLMVGDRRLPDPGETDEEAQSSEGGGSQQKRREFDGVVKGIPGRDLPGEADETRRWASDGTGSLVLAHFQTADIDP